MEKGAEIKIKVIFAESRLTSDNLFIVKLEQEHFLFLIDIFYVLWWNPKGLI